ncbi:hypothetical protein [Bradyrhizobium sp. CCBAU 51627]|uniref:hypothetical protein n=1 Tax=Bradyrhizobium sp. CCBAU 51627 TaxID=1325088 RepID=UPI002306D2F9|nr:hypothetical protein [Bradyrhizobium sp. CCBAU 51627]MDA9432984.1 hypothetical protein [Bradyrhizobium sp. CCBAU 51627]
MVYDDFVIGSDDNIPLHLHVLPAASLITDAKARNRVFEEVLRFNMIQAASAVVVPVPDPMPAK